MNITFIQIVHGDIIRFFLDEIENSKDKKYKLSNTVMDLPCF